MVQEYPLKVRFLLFIFQFQGRDQLEELGIVAYLKLFQNAHKNLSQKFIKN
jgi:hypothetical protein